MSGKVIPVLRDGISPSSQIPISHLRKLLHTFKRLDRTLSTYALPPLAMLYHKQTLTSVDIHEFAWRLFDLISRSRSYDARRVSLPTDVS